MVFDSPPLLLAHSRILIHTYVTCSEKIDFRKRKVLVFTKIDPLVTFRKKYKLHNN